MARDAAAAPSAAKAERASQSIRVTVTTSPGEMFQHAHKLTPVKRPGYSKSELATSASSARSVRSSSMAAAVESPSKSCSCARIV
jgi:hypothetical protein